MPYKSNSELKNIAKEKLSGKYGSAMLVSPVIECALCVITALPIVTLVLVPYIVNCVINNSPIEQSVLYVIAFIIAIPCRILIGILNTGISLFYLNIVCGNQYSISDLFFGFRRQFKKSLALSVITVSLNTLFMMPYYICSYLEAYTHQLQWSILTPVVYIVGIALYLPIYLSLSQCYYLLLDFPQYSTRELLRLSTRIMKGHKKRLLYIHLSFIPLDILCILSYYIGYLWYIPYKNMTLTLFFLDIMKPKQTE